MRRAGQIGGMMAALLAFGAGAAEAEILLGFERFTSNVPPQQGDMAQVMTESVLADVLAAMEQATCPMRMVETLRLADLEAERALQASPLVDPASRVGGTPHQPNVMVRGRVIDSGTSTVWRIEAVRSDTGAVLATHQGGTANDTIFDATEKIAAALVADLCPKPPSPAYHVSCGGGDPVEQDVCDIAQPFVLEGALFGVGFSGGMAGTTRFVRTPALAGLNWSGEGSYTVTLPEGPGKPGSLTITAGGTTTAGGLSRTTSGQDICALTPIPACP
ncbi:hypothetical protein C8J30_101107 [Rhodobacter viridis]|uniref:Uncharacterized protein n=1 Tax=Rhodobacter viridis TaxID=1054202 RepID=A0A318U577_9RHOB|nr:hypothetical protein [Rhodobacter viridis]PYF12726.1 hypothetical protein C8J30_101107 [Rhodobacter viridis]